MGIINRLKYHLEQILGHEVGICLVATLQINHISSKSLLDLGKKRDDKDVAGIERAVEEIARFKGVRSDKFYLTMCFTMPSMTSSLLVLRTTGGAQPSIRSVVKLKEKQKADSPWVIFPWSDIPFRIAMANPFYKSMLDAIAILGQGTRPLPMIS